MRRCCGGAAAARRWRGGGGSAAAARRRRHGGCAAAALLRRWHCRGIAAARRVRLQIRDTAALSSASRTRMVRELEGGLRAAKYLTPGQVLTTVAGRPAAQKGHPQRSRKVGDDSTNRQGTMHFCFSEGAKTMWFPCVLAPERGPEIQQLSHKVSRELAQLELNEGFCNVLFRANTNEFTK